jgi:nitroimidazol reductase NimA-like FMN-containing flavoprotein (pyridoxamine 5'-phosphate oxidase superfamily)
VAEPGGGDIRLSREQAWATLAAAHTGILTTLRADGVPITLPTWFVALDGRIYVASPSHRKKLVRLARDPRVSFLVESGERWAELCGVHLTGMAHVVDDARVIARVRAAMDAKYAAFRTARSAMPTQTREVYEVTTVVVEIVPDERILSWDNSRLSLGPGPG